MDKVVKLVSGGLLSTGPTPSSFMMVSLKITLREKKNMNVLYLFCKYLVCNKKKSVSTTHSINNIYEMIYIYIYGRKREIQIPPYHVNKSPSSQAVLYSGSFSIGKQVSKDVNSFGSIQFVHKIFLDFIYFSYQDPFLHVTPLFKG